MRLLHLVFGGSLESGYGRWRYVTSLVRALSDRGVESRVIAMDGKSSTRVALYRERQTVLESPYPFDGHHEHLGVALRNLHLGAESLDRVRAEAERVDVVVLHDWEPALAANLLKNVSSVPVALTLHRAMVGADRENLDTWDAYAREMEEWICRRADRVIVPGGWMRSELVSQYGISEKDIHVVPGGVEPGGTPVDVNLPEFRTLFAKPGESLVLFAGRLVAGRGLLLLLEAAEETLRARPGIKFVLAGDGPERSRIQNEVTRRNLQDSVRLTGFLGTLVLSALYRASDVLVVPSTRENPGSSALESLAHGTPVVATTVGGLSEMADRCTGITLVSTASGADLAKGILSRLSKEPESTHVPDEFSWAEVARRSEAVYQSIMASVGS